MTTIENKEASVVQKVAPKFKVPSSKINPEPIAPAVAAPTGSESQHNATSASTATCPLLTAMWRSPDRIHQIGVLDRQTKKFRNLHVNGIAAAITRALDLSGEGYDTYFALADYLTPNSRIAANAYGASALWADVDCGAEKADAGKGYATLEDARLALTQFCKEAGVPEPTHTVDSGSGLHVYWALDKVVEREVWQAYAAKFKALTHALNFLADDSRTADIASVLRVPGTLNYKYDPPRPVTLLQATEQYTEQSAMLQAIDSAHERLCPVILKVATPNTVNVDASQSSHDRVPSTDNDTAKLIALLDRIDPDSGGYQNWLNGLMAIYHETGGSEEGFELANDWSSNGKSYKGEKEIRIKWNSFKSGTANPITIATLVKMAKDSGADVSAIFAATDEQFEPCVTEVVYPNAPHSSTSIVDEKSVMAGSVNPFYQYSLRGMSDEMEKNVVAADPLLDEIALMGQVTVYFAKGNVGKTVISFKLLLDAIKAGRVDPNRVYYLNVDDTSTGLVEKNRIAEEYNFHMLAEGHREFSATAFKSILRDMVENDQAMGVVLILDTLKKFVNLMDKNQTSAFTNVIRPFVSKGGTVIALAHTNKNPDKNGNPVYGGVSDIMNDIDCAYTIAEVSAENGVKVVEFVNVKRRGNVAYNASYSYCYGNNVSYHELLSSVQPVDDMDLGAVKLVEAIKSDADIIEAVKACINDGVNTKMKLADATAKRADISRRAALQVIERYAGTNPDLHRWTFSKGAHGAMQYVLLATPQPDADQVLPEAIQGHLVAVGEDAF